MLSLVEARSSQGVLALPLDDISSGYAISNIDGLGPVKATLVSSSTAGQDGAQFVDARREPRNLILNIEFDPLHETETVEDLRNRTYAYFMTKSSVQLDFVTSSGRRLRIDGIVESSEPSYFTAEPGLSVTIICYDPDFVNTASEKVTGTTTEGSTGFVVPYSGTVETGFLFKLMVNRAVSEFTIYHRLPNDVLRQLDFSHPMVAGDILEISTVPGAKSARLKSGSTTSSVMYGVSPTSSWLRFFQGNNTIRVYTPGAPIPYEIEYTRRYGAL